MPGIKAQINQNRRWEGQLFQEGIPTPKVEYETEYDTDKVPIILLQFYSSSNRFWFHQIIRDVTLQ